MIQHRNESNRTIEDGEPQAKRGRGATSVLVVSSALGFAVAALAARSASAQAFSLLALGVLCGMLWRSRRADRLARELTLEISTQRCLLERIRKCGLVRSWSHDHRAGVRVHSGPIEVEPGPPIRSLVERARDQRGGWDEIRREGPRWIRSIVDVDVEHGEVTRIFGLSQDVTLQKETEERLATAQKMETIGQLTAGVAHEINTPTQFVRDNLAFLAEEFPRLLDHISTLRALLAEAQTNTGPDFDEAARQSAEDHDIDFLKSEIPTAIEQSEEGISRIGRIVSALKEFSHPSEIEMSQGDINRAIQSAITLGMPRWKTVARISTDLDQTCPPVPCYIDEINQVILILIVNAADALGEVCTDPDAPGRILVATRLEPEAIRIEIEDDGPGIPDAVAERIFDPFFTTKGIGEGTGQGLSIAERIVVGRHGGTIECESTVGVGTKFIARLPLQQPTRRRHRDPFSATSSRPEP